MFSEESDVTVVITCCGRVDLLKATLDSFFNYNTYPIKQVVITEDAGDKAVYGVIPGELKEHFTIIINEEKLGQIRSIDKAYALVDTPYIFHCEEDWQFYRKGFIEDSKRLLASNTAIYQVWLRSFHHDIQRDYPFHSLGEEIVVNGVTAHKLLSSRSKWQGFSFNPGLRRHSDYKAIKGGYTAFLGDDKESINVESALSQHMNAVGAFAVILENDAVLHIGYEQHIANKKEKRKRLKKKALVVCFAISIFQLGWLAAKL
ncbi:glycosyltransferase family 2 protein [Candidatus Sororendozoicomonas aggregata]|uniref:glycosyltransferase family 2 protein n=1 Tax=Candidatus Sororendozoicomonas aggregata TaxID=3073239 RepID=UPI002ED52DCD